MTGSEPRDVSMFDVVGAAAWTREQPSRIVGSTSAKIGKGMKAAENKECGSQNKHGVEQAR